MEDREEQLKRELSDCVMNSSWVYCVAGVALAIPWGVKKKSYWPVPVMGLVGTMLDILNGYSKCKEQRSALQSFLAASKEAVGEQSTGWEATLAQQDQAAEADQQQRQDGQRE